MKVLIAGGAGYVAGILRPSLESEHECLYLDLMPIPGVEHRTVIGSIADEAAVARAVDGQDAVIQLAMANPSVRENIIGRSYDVHVKGMHVLLQAAADAGVKRVIYASSMSVYRRCGQAFHNSEDDPPDATDVYGLTKRLAEEVCRAFALAHSQLSVIALRMVHPVTPQRWAERKARGEDTAFSTGPKDLGRLYLAALGLENHTGFDAVQACSDLEQKRLNLAKARTLLGWEPRGE